VAALPALHPSRVVVVSCDPATLARDAAALAAAGYLLEALRPVDLFPQTAHLETVALFRRRP
jgi:23S rRNA (uracil1939-C5)-methyltransferase